MVAQVSASRGQAAPLVDPLLRSVAPQNLVAQAVDAEMKFPGGEKDAIHDSNTDAVANRRRTSRGGHHVNDPGLPEIVKVSDAQLRAAGYVSAEASQEGTSPVEQVRHVAAVAPGFDSW